MTEKQARKTFDWEAIEAEYRAGLKSTREIARIHGITETSIRKRARSDGWERDLSDKIRREVRTTLVRKEARTASLDEKSIVKVAVATRVEISHRQRERIVRLTGIADKIVARIDALNADGEITDYGSADKAVSVVDKAARAVGQLIALERQAYAMDEPTAEKNSSPVEDLVKRLTDMANREGAI